MVEEKIETTVPIHVDDEMDVEIESRGERGDGVAKVDGFIVFVPNTKVGDKIRVMVQKVFRKFAIGRKMLISEEDIKIEEENDEELDK